MSIIENYEIHKKSFKFQIHKISQIFKSAMFQNFRKTTFLKKLQNKNFQIF